MDRTAGGLNLLAANEGAITLVPAAAERERCIPAAAAGLDLLGTVDLVVHVARRVGVSARPI
jgi:hypothetical protein